MKIDAQAGPATDGQGGAPEDPEGPIWTTDAAGAAVGFDGRWEALTGLSAADSLGAGWLDALHPDDRPRFEQLWREGLERGAPFAADLPLRGGPDGTAITMRARAAPIRDGSGVVTQWVVVLSPPAGRPPRDRGREGLERFAAVAAHDLQEPLRKIVAFGDRLAERAGEALDARGRDYLERMVAAASRMRGLIDGLLDVARASGKGRPRVAVDLAAVADEVLADLELLVERTGGRVEVGPLPTIPAEPTQMRQLLQNLIANALKFHRPGEAPRVRVSARTVTGEGGPPSFLLEVVDDGVGFDAADLGRILRPFERLQGRASVEGSGLGLAICRAIVEAHSGRITATSAPGEGATFRVALPMPHPTPGTDPMLMAFDATRPADRTPRRPDPNPGPRPRQQTAGADPRGRGPGGRDV